MEGQYWQESTRTNHGMYYGTLWTDSALALDRSILHTTAERHKHLDTKETTTLSKIAEKLFSIIHVFCIEKNNVTGYKRLINH